MNCTEARERLAEVALGHAIGPAERQIRAHVAECPECQRDYASLRLTLDALDSSPTPRPSPRLRESIYAAIEAEARAQRSAQAVTRGSARAGQSAAGWRRLLQPLAAAALLAVGFGVGARVSSPPLPPAGDPAARQEIAQLRARVDSMSQWVESSVLAKRPANDRLERVLAYATVAHPDGRLITGLIDTLALDPSVNVRLNALGALYPHAGQDVVRAGVVACLPRESSPLIQVAMLDFLVAARDRDAASEIQKLATDDHINPDVKESARRALEQL
jgi:hypothetical protein